METRLTTRSPSQRGAAWALTQSLWLAITAVLAYTALRFVVRDPLHYLVRPTPESFGAHYWPHRLTLSLHIVGGLAALLAGPFQLWSGLRRRMLRLHRVAGYAYVVGIALAGGAAFALARYAEPRDFGVALAALATAWWTCVVMAFVAIRRRRIDQHRQWMIRGYVVTFAFTTFRYLIDLPIWDPRASGRRPDARSRGPAIERDARGEASTTCRTGPGASRIATRKRSAPSS